MIRVPSLLKLNLFVRQVLIILLNGFIDVSKREFTIRRICTLRRSPHLIRYISLISNGLLLSANKCLNYKNTETFNKSLCKISSMPSCIKCPLNMPLNYLLYNLKLKVILMSLLNLKVKVILMSYLNRRLM